MRPAILFPLFASIDTLPGVGPSLAKTLGKLSGERVVDLLWHLPQATIDRRLSPSIASVCASASLSTTRHGRAAAPTESSVRIIAAS